MRGDVHEVDLLVIVSSAFLSVREILLANAFGVATKAPKLLDYSELV